MDRHHPGPVATYQRDNTERLRPHFVSHQGKQDMEVAAATWPDMFAAFAEQLAQRTVPGRASLFSQPFSATSPTQSLVMQAAVMEATQAYYEYSAWLICGIPSVRLLDTVDDWLDLQTRLDLRLSQLDSSLTEWEARLTWIVGEMVASRRGTVDTSFWQSFYRLQIRPFSMFAGCAGPPDTLDGHLTSFFPYISADPWHDKYVGLDPNPAIFPVADDVNQLHGEELSLSDVPTGVSRVEFV